jgi:hypothetical protein
VPRIPPEAASDDPNGYIDQLYKELPNFFLNGGCQSAVDAVFGGLSTALAHTIGGKPGACVGLRLFASPWGWAPDDSLNEGDFDLAAVDGPSAASDDGVFTADFEVGNVRGYLFVPAEVAGGWRRWSPARGPAPSPEDGHMRVVIVLRRDTDTEATICQVREVFGHDPALPFPLYKSALRLAAASATETEHLMGTLRALLTSKEAA